MAEYFPSTINILGTEIEVLTLVVTILIITIGISVATIVKLTITRLLGKYIPDPTEILIKRILYWGIIAVTVFSAFGNLGVDFTGVLLAGGIIGIVIGFATQSIVANLISGIFLQLDRAVKIGDPVEVVDMGVSGIMKEITAFSTRIRRWDGVLIRIPNDKIFTSQLRNFYGHIARRVEVTVGIAYKEDASAAIQLIQDMASRNPKIFAEPAPQVMVWELADSSVNILTKVWTVSQEWFPVRIEIMGLLKDLLDNAGIEIPFPHRTLWFGESKDGTKDTLQVAVKEANEETKATLVSASTRSEESEVISRKDKDVSAEDDSSGADGF